MATALTVVTVVLNPGEALVETIESVVSQDFENLEFVIVDGGSTDGTTHRVRAYGNAVDRFISEPDHGIYDAMNKGISVANGEWVCFLNAGDRFETSDTIAGLFREKSLLKRSDIVYGNTILCSGAKCELCEAGNLESLLERNVFCHQSSVVRRSVLLRYRFEIRFRICADARFFMQCYLAGLRFSHFPGLMTYYDCSGVSSNVRKRILERWYITHDLGVDSAELDSIYLQRLITEAGVSVRPDSDNSTVVRVAGNALRAVWTKLRRVLL